MVVQSGTVTLGSTRPGLAAAGKPCTCNHHSVPSKIDCCLQAWSLPLIRALPVNKLSCPE